MGIIKSNVEVLLDAKSRGVNFGSTLTLGRLKWYVTGRELVNAANRYNVDASNAQKELESAEYSDGFFTKVLGANELTALDNSEYEGASFSHDLNITIPQRFEQKFDVVIDSGTLEHVFNFPTALANCMKMLKVGGTLFICTPANNHMGHGFYQFSPELFYRVFQNENGFAMQRALLLRHPYPGAELSSRQSLYDVVDANVVRQRVGLVDSKPTLLVVEAKKLEHKEVFASYPQQSCYTRVWDNFEFNRDGEQAKRKSSRYKPILKALFGVLPQNAKSLIWGNYWTRLYSIRNRNFYRKSTGHSPKQSNKQEKSGADSNASD